MAGTFWKSGVKHIYNFDGAGVYKLKGLFVS